MSLIINHQLQTSWFFSSLLDTMHHFLMTLCTLLIWMLMLLEISENFNFGAQFGRPQRSMRQGFISINNHHQQYWVMKNHRMQNKAKNNYCSADIFLHNNKLTVYSMQRLGIFNEYTVITVITVITVSITENPWLLLFF